MGLRSGYKQTEIGAIPEDWSCQSFGDLYSEPSRNGIYKRAEFRGRGTRIVNMGEMFGLEFISNQEMSRVELTPYEGSLSCLQDGDLLFGRRSVVPAGAGKCALVVRPGEPLTFESSIIRVRLDRAKTLPRFYYYFFASPIGRSVVSAIISGTNIKGIKASELRDLKVALPPLGEQESISEALSDVDAAIDTLEQLLVKKRHLKQAAMQELLSGRKRLPEFSAESSYRQTEVGMLPADWKVMPLAECVGAYIDYRGRTPRKLGMSWGGGDILALSANNVQMGKIDFEADAYFGGEQLYRRWMSQGDCEPGDVLLTTEAPLGNVAEIPDSKRYILSQRVLLIRPKDFLLRAFLAHFMRGNYFQSQLLMSSSGSTAKGIQRRRLGQLLVYFPAQTAEQAGIASVISDMSAEIATLEAKLTKARQLKHGMMQELLTGRIRLI